MKQRFSFACEWILEMGKLLREAVISPFDFSTKTGHQDIVTEYDKKVEQYFRSNIHKNFPDDIIVGEEYANTIENKEGIVWYIDPIDGTTNFVNLRKHFAISIGCYQNERPYFALVLDVIGNDLYTAFVGEGAFKNQQRIGLDEPASDFRKMILSTPNVPDAFWRDYPWRSSMRALADEVRAVRSLGSVALELCAVAEGVVDIFVAMRSAPWDHNAARLILQESGCYISALGQSELPVDKEMSIFACRSKVVYHKLRETYGF